jgi:beta-lactam-binding protein with PASTA domain/tRNA A-37 threonylcarbamoyl transferase component Bud32
VTTEGALLAGRFRLGPVLGHGGMSEVRRARDERMGRWVAVKLLRPELVRDPAFEGRFRREAQSAGSLHNPAIVAVYHTGEEYVDGARTPYIVMELVEGRTLRDILAVDGRLGRREALRITSAVCAALDEAHRAGIVHRDVKPGNVMLTPAGQVKVMDFGIAHATATAITMTQTAEVVGTAHYLSPEQARGEHVDARSDVYSTGCLLYELLTGSPPFTGDSVAAIAYQHVGEDPIPPSRLAADVPPELDAVVLKALAKNPAERYQTAGELRDDIERLLADRPVTAAPPPAAEPPVPVPPPTTVLVREPPRRRGRGVGYVLLALATIAVFVVAALIARAALSGGSGDLETPDVVGQSLSQAQQILAQAGLTVQQPLKYRYSGQPRGTVLGQIPTHPILVRRGASVQLVVSKGRHLVTIPADIAGQPQSVVTAELKAAGFEVRSVPVNSDKPAGNVLSSSPAAGGQALFGSTVVLRVSNGKQPVPDVVNQPADTGSRRLQRAGFAVVERPSSSYERSVPIGTIVAQNPPGGSAAAVGSTVEVFVNEPPAQPSKSSKPTKSSPAPTTSSGSPAPSKSKSPGH